MEHHADGVDVNADVGNEVKQDDDRRKAARHGPKAPLEIFGNRAQPLVVDDGQPDQQQDAHPIPVIEIGLAAADTVDESLLTVFLKAVTADSGRNARKGDQPPRKTLAAKKEILGRSRVPGKVRSEPHDAGKIKERHDKVEMPPHKCTGFHQTPASCGT